MGQIKLVCLSRSILTGDAVVYTKYTSGRILRKYIGKNTLLQATAYLPSTVSKFVFASKHVKHTDDDILNTHDIIFV